MTNWLFALKELSGLLAGGDKPRPYISVPSDLRLLALSLLPAVRLP